MINVLRIGRALGLTIGAASAAVGLAGVGALVALRRPLPRINGEETVPGLQRRVQVLRDRWGVPHIYAETNADLFMVLGYVHAQDRLWQMDLNRRTGHGQLAELFGLIALSSDQFVRVLGLSRVARREMDLLDEESYSILDAYARGVNAFIESHLNRLPLEFVVLRYQPRPWEIVDSLVWGKVMALNQAGNWTTELLHARVVAMLGEERARELLPRYLDEQPIIVPSGISYSCEIGAGALRAAAKAAPFIGHPDAGQGSNSWVVGGQQSATGKPVLANDPHLALSMPVLWYEAHLNGGDYAVGGATFPGAPGVIAGHNEHIAWGLTSAMADVQDLYIERFHADDRLRYEWRGDWKPAEVVHEEIAVKGRSQPVVEEVRITRHGPVVSSILAPPDGVLEGFEASSQTAGEASSGVEEMALRWTALEPGRVIHAVLALNRARNWDEFRAALAEWSAPVQNFSYADVDGHYGYALAGMLPIRAQGDGKLPVPGWNGENEWTGYIPAAGLPAAYDPLEGFVVLANHRIATDAYAFSKDLQGEWLNGYRAMRVRDLIKATPQHTVTDSARIQIDVHSLPGLELARLIADLPLLDPLERQVRDMLVQWDGELRADSVGACVYTVLRYYLERRVYVELGDLRGATAGLGVFGLVPSNTYMSRAFPGILARIAAAEDRNQHDPWLGEGRTWNGVLQECIALTVVELRERLGKDPRSWTYGRLHRLTLRHPLGSVPALSPVFNRGPWPANGDGDTVCMGHDPRDTAAGPLFVAPSYRQICDTSDWDASLSVLPGGQSGHPGSRHYNDMVQLWRSGKYHPMLWSRERIEEATVDTLILAPDTPADE